MNIQNISKKGTLPALVALAMLIGAVGSNVLKANAANAQSASAAQIEASSVTPVVTNPVQSNTNNTQPRMFKSNEDPTHEAKESAQWETQENAGQAPWQHQPVNGSQ